MTNNNPIYIGNVNPSGRGMNGAVYDSAGISPTLTTNKGEGIKVKMSTVIIYDDYNRRIKSDQTCIGTVMPNFKNDALGNGSKLIETDAEITMVGGLQEHQTPRSDGICPCINSAAGMGGGQTPIAIRPNFRVRKLTPKECWKLMGFEPVDFEKARDAMNQNIYNGNDRSGSQLYKQAGNSIVVDVLLHIMENLYEVMPYLFDDMVIGSFFSGIGAFEKALTRLEPNTPFVDGDGKDLDLKQVGYINDYNGDANRIYDGSTVSRALKAEAGGGRSEDRLVHSGVIVDDTMGFEEDPRLYEGVCPSLRASRQGLKTITSQTNGGGQPMILDVKQMGREGHPRYYGDGIAPTLAARDYKDPLRVMVNE